MMPSASPSAVMALCSFGVISCETSALAMSPASSRNSTTVDVTLCPWQAASSQARSEIRSASSRDDEGSLVPALMITSLNGSWAVLVTCISSAAAPPRYGRSQVRVLGLGFRAGVLIRRPAGDVVAAVRVRPRLPGCLIPVLGPHQAGVRRRRRCLRVAPGLGFLPQHWYDLAAEQLQLVQHGRQRQARVVHEEQLPLVVAEVLAEGEGLVDDLLRAADRQRCHLHEVLHGGPVPVDRGLVEIRPELAHRVL